MQVLVLVARTGVMLAGFTLIGLGINNIRNGRPGASYIFWGFILTIFSIN